MSDIETISRLFSNLKEIENNRVMLEEIKHTLSTINDKISSDEDGITLKFSANEKMSASMAAKAIGVKQTELMQIVEKGELLPYSETKMIFRTSDVKNYIKNFRI